MLTRRAFTTCALCAVAGFAATAAEAQSAATPIKRTLLQRTDGPAPGYETLVVSRVAASSLNPLEYKLADLNFMGRTPPVVLGLDLSGIVIAAGHGARGVAVGDAVAAMADLNGNGGWSATEGPGGAPYTRDGRCFPASPTQISSEVI
jgi:NADPH:quinone reductase-like Zn-dependent oxidoreductase